MQEAFLKLWGRPKLWDPNKRAKFTTWFYKVIVNQCFDHNKKKKPAILIMEIVLILQANMGCLHDGYKDYYVCSTP